MAEKLSKEQVAHVAHLARLALTEDELEQYSQQLSAVLEYVDQLQTVETAGIEPVAQVTGLVNVLQDDEVAADPIVTADFLAGAPATEPPYLKVKAVLE